MGKASSHLVECRSQEAFRVIKSIGGKMFLTLRSLQRGPDRAAVFASLLNNVIKLIASRHENVPQDEAAGKPKKENKRRRV